MQNGGPCYVLRPAIIRAKINSAATGWDSRQRKSSLQLQAVTCDVQPTGANALAQLHLSNPACDNEYLGHCAWFVRCPFVLLLAHNHSQTQYQMNQLHVAHACHHMQFDEF